MTDADFERVLETLTNLWPKETARLTSEQANVWRTVCDPYPWEWCQQELRGLAMSIKFFPKPCELAERLKASSQSNKSNKVRPEPTNGQLDRANLLQAWPEHRKLIDKLSDEEAAMHLAKHYYNRAVEVYGPTARGTVDAYWKWQKAAHRAGLREPPVEYIGWSPEAEREYRVERGLPLDNEDQGRQGD